jgi:SAM-dependent methyltransferase
VLVERLPRRNSAVLDTGAGLGKEVEFLLKKGFTVEANEIDREFNRVLRERLRGVTVYAVDWRNIEEIGKKYGALLCVGNSLSMLDPSEREDVIRKFYNMLVEGGVLVLDARNYAEMARALQNGPLWKSELMERLGWEDYMYRGNARLRLEGDYIFFEFYDEEGNFIGDIKTCPVLKEEVLGYLKAAGFRKVEVYGDMGRKEKPAYYQFVAVR